MPIIVIASFCLPFLIVAGHGWGIGITMVVLIISAIGYLTIPSGAASQPQKQPARQPVPPVSAAKEKVQIQPPFPKVVPSSYKPAPRIASVPSAPSVDGFSRAGLIFFGYDHVNGEEVWIDPHPIPAIFQPIQKRPNGPGRR
jgi:hypothetical protein